MFELREPKFEWGQRVTALTDLFNDGSHPEVPLDALLVAEGSTGEIVQIGHHEEANLPVYMVEFADGPVGTDDKPRPCVVGVLEEEIAPA
ncbi:nitrogen fixation protein NifZ [Methyloversatilis sp. XJ19-49]|uniref:nitrogen fixation protein NifZ n=1 Tax=Methyloversatilis sp. XJ19-49 TaxID=2963429 RepID=UPI00211C69A3|nr:nitrogen fixation protein NifZ [Methyloversatilis sp. XJ19-49]